MHLFFEKNIRCNFYVCQINLSKFNTSWVSILGFLKVKNEGKIASCGREISKRVVWSKQTGRLIGANGPSEVTKRAFWSNQTGRLITSNWALFRVKKGPEKDIKMEPPEYQQDRKCAIFSLFEGELEVGDFRAILTRRFVLKIQNIVHARVRNECQKFW